MSERKYKVGDVIRTLVDIDAEGNKLFPKGTIGTITEIADYKDSLYQYKVDANEDWWYYNADMIEPVDEDGAPKQDPCYDTISRQAVSSWLEQYGQDVLHGKYKFSLMYIWKNIMDLPPVTPQPKTGHWIIISPTDMYCSECNEIEHLDTSRRFCAYCGTKMVEPQRRSE